MGDSNALTDSIQDDPYASTETFDLPFDIEQKEGILTKMKQKEKLAILLSAISIFIMLIITVSVVSLCFWLIGEGSQHNNNQEFANQIIDHARSNSALFFGLLTEFTDMYPGRICSSDNLQNGIQWMQNEWENRLGFNNTSLQRVGGVPNWKRNNASLELLIPGYEILPVLALGNSIATPESGITAHVIVVANFEELEKRKKFVPGNIVLFNAVFTTYHETVIYRVQGAIEASKYGAVASLVRSITPFSLQTPHAGVMRYSDDYTPIPHAAVTLETADYFQRLEDSGTSISVRLYMNCESGELTESYNIIAEIKGSERPEEIILMGGHIDSWDVGRGAMDDAGGVIACISALHTIQSLGLTPKRTIRVIAWVDEENTGAGEKAYYNSLNSKDISNHILAIESDIGVFSPVGFTYTHDATAAQIDFLQQTVDLMNELGNSDLPMHISEGEGGADTSMLHEKGFVPVSELLSDNSRYFWYHHTVADTIDKLSPSELADCVAALGILTFVVANNEIPFNQL